MSEHVVELDGVRKTFRDFWLRPLAEAVCGVTLTVERGDVFGLLGPNGSGKSTTLKMVLGLIAPTAGRVRLFGSDPRSRAVRSRLGYLPELSALHPFLTARETLRYHAGLAGMGGASARTRVDELIEEMGLSAAANRPVGGYSKGMQRRVAFAAALVAKPELLVLDEPTSGLDPIGTREVKNRMSALAKGGMTILVTSHHLFDMQDVCSRVAILSQGRVVGSGEVAGIVERSTDKRHALEEFFEKAIASGGEDVAERGGGGR